MYQFAPNAQEWIDPLGLLETSVSALKNNNCPNNVADVLHISLSDNRDAGSSIRAALSHLSDGVQVKFKII